MKYIELKVHASRQGVEAVTELLLRNGISSVSVEDPADLDDILEKKNEYGWDYIDDSVKDRPQREPVVKAYLEDSEEGQRQLQHLKEKIMNLKSLELEGHFGWDVDFGRLYAEAETVDDEDWKDRWKENFHPMKISDSIVIRPTWEDYDADPGEKVIQLDPGMAFGTGSHETTRLCIQLMEKYAGCEAATGSGSEENHPEGQAYPTIGRLLDVGCGSGILAIGGALLGFDEVLGIEIDPDAVEVARENLQINGVADRVKVQQGDLAEGIDFKADMVVANLMADLVIRLADDCGRHLTEGGLFISSGILIEKRDEVAKAIEAAGFIVEEIAEEGEWCAIAARMNVA